MKKEILKNLDRYPYFKILSIPKYKKYKLKKEFFSVAKKLGETRYQNLKKDKIVEIKPNLKNNFKPYHLYFCNFNNQLLMIKKTKKYEIIKYEIYETGWPYNSGSIIKKSLEKVAIFFSKINIFGFKIGNRARIVCKKI